ncbi:MAG: four helix bundle protein [Planctomycetia bacterium]|nr:four helix bundle protein [Planctomycetia bacterium]
MAVKSFRELIAWQKGMDLVEAVYLATRDFPKEETYGLRQQIRRAAVSIPSNIAEGQGRRSTREFLSFLSIALGSLRELGTQLLIAGRLRYLETSTCDALATQCGEVARILSGLSKALNREE